MLDPTLRPLVVTDFMKSLGGATWGRTAWLVPQRTTGSWFDGEVAVWVGRQGPPIIVARATAPDRPRMSSRVEHDEHLWRSMARCVHTQKMRDPAVPTAARLVDRAVPGDGGNVAGRLRGHRRRHANL
jgi:hypothetical protein